MRRLRQRKPGLREWPRDAQIMLATGSDDFNCGVWPSIFDLPPDERDRWPGEIVLQEMREAWEQHGDDLILEFERLRPLWAELVFEGGVAPGEAIDLLERGETRKAWHDMESR